MKLTWNKETEFFDFETEDMVGTLVSQGKLQGIRRLMHKKDMQDFIGTYPIDYPAYGLRRGDKLYLLNIYHLLARNLPSGHTGRTMEHEYITLENGVELTIKPSTDCPVTHKVRYEIKEPNVIDLTLSLTSHASLSAYEVWVSSYFYPKLIPYIYLYKNPARSDIKAEHFVAILENEFIRDWWGGGYLFFPRDNKAACLVFDGRWGEKYQPFIFGPYYARPLMVTLNKQTGIAFIQMARQEDCIALYSSWIRATAEERPNTAEYFVFFGEDLKPDDTRTARMRSCLIEMREDFNIPLKVYEHFINEP